MTRFGIASTAMGTASLVASVTWFAMGSATQPDDRGHEPPGDQAGGTLVVCTGQDGILRAFKPSPGCPPGQTLLPLIPETGGYGGNDTLDVLDFDDEPRSKPEPRFKDDPLADLERRIADLRRAAAVFTVVDTQGKRLFTISPGAIRLYNASGAAVAAVRSADDGAVFRAMSADGSSYAAVGAAASRAAIRLGQGDVLRLEAGRHPTGTSSLRIPTREPSGNPVVGIGESTAGTGALITADLTGRVRASMTITDGRGTIAIYNRDGTSVVSLRQAMSGAGLLALGDAGGGEAVKMDVNPNRYGAVLAGPRLGLPLVTGSGLPGSYFLGCSGGEACRPY